MLQNTLCGHSCIGMATMPCTSSGTATSADTCCIGMPSTGWNISACTCCAGIPMTAEISGRRPKMPCIGMLKLACRAVSIATEAVSNCIGTATGAAMSIADKAPVIVCLGIVRAMVLRAQFKRLAG